MLSLICRSYFENAFLSDVGSLICTRLIEESKCSTTNNWGCAQSGFSYGPLVLLLCVVPGFGQLVLPTAAHVDEPRRSTGVGSFSVGLARMSSTASAPVKFTLDSPISSRSWVARESEREGPEAQASQTSGAGAQELAQKLPNPVASLISVPFQFNFDYELGPEEEGFRFTMNFQPVIPMSLNQNWNLISRTILPVMHQRDVIDTTSQNGIGDIVQSFFFSPSKTQPFIWGLGPVFLIPTATDELLESEKFGVGPTLVALKQQGHWTYGVLWNHIWSVAGDADRTDVNGTFLQPFLSYATSTGWSYTFNLESTYDWEGEQWGVPIHVQVTKLLKFGKQPVSIGGGLR